MSMIISIGSRLFWALFWGIAAALLVVFVGLYGLVECVRRLGVMAWMAVEHRLYWREDSDAAAEDWQDEGYL